MWLSLKKAFVWAKAHWRWLVFSAGALVVLVVTRKQNKAMLLSAESALRVGKNEMAAMDEAHKKEAKRRKHAKKKHDKALQIIEEAHEIAWVELDKAKKAELQKNIKKAKNDPDEIDKILRDQFGFREVK